MPVPHPVKIELARRGETQRQCAAAIGVSAGSLNLVLNGHMAPWPALRDRLAEYLGCPADTLFSGDALRTAAADLVQRTAVDRGLPAEVDDPAVLQRVATIVGEAQ